jgi:hypothetical protein
MTPLVFKPEAIKWRNIYAPFENGWHRPTFSLVLHADQVALPEEYLEHVNAKDELRLRSALRPPVYLAAGSYDVLTRALAILDAQNRPRDHVFDWCHLITVFVETWSMVARWGVMQGKEISGLSPASLTITLDEERIPA